MVLFNRGDTTYLLLDCTLNGDPIEDGQCEEIEVQINPEDSFRSVKKLLSKGEIVYMTDMEYETKEGDEWVTKTFTGYVCALSQQDTFKIAKGESDFQIRALYNGEVGSTDLIPKDIGDSLSTEVLT